MQHKLITQNITSQLLKALNLLNKGKPALCTFISMELVHKHLKNHTISTLTVQYTGIPAATKPFLKVTLYLTKSAYRLTLCNKSKT